MGNFARALHHLDMKDVKKKRLEKIAAQKLKEKKDREEKKIIQEISKKYKSDWKREIYEGMTTANAATITVAPAEGDGTVTAVDAIDASSYSGTVTGLLGTDGISGNTGSVIRDSGSGSGQDGGFNVGGKYLSFQGDGYNETGHSIRWAALAPIDSSRINSLTITAIVGNDSNGGEDPDATFEDLRVMYKTSSMSSFAFLNINPNGPNGATDSDVIIPLGASGNSGLNNYSIEIPEYARGKDTEFVLMQTVSSGTGFDNYGITNIKFQRTTPVNVVVPLDDPEAISFVRVGSDEGDPKKRKKKLNDQLAASDEYTQAQLGDDFPGGGARVGGDDPFASAKIGDDVEPSPIGKAEVKKSYSSFSADAVTDTDKDADTTQVVITPSTQTTMNPTNDEGDPISVKSVGGKNSGVVQGADAANLDAQNAQDDAQDKQDDTQDDAQDKQDDTQEPELDPEELKASEEEKEGKTEEEIENLEQQKIKDQADLKFNALQKLLNPKITNDLRGFNLLAQGAKLVLQGLLGAAAIIDRLNTASNWFSNTYGAKAQKIDPTAINAFQTGVGKLLNSLDIAQSVLTGKVVNFTPTQQEMRAFTGSISPDLFEEGSSLYIPISSMRHEYQDENIYVMNGKVYNNQDEKATDLTGKEYQSMGEHGGGYAQMIIPEDGSAPYLHYYDYNYENLNNIADVAAGGGILSNIRNKIDEGWENAFLKSLSNIIHQLRPDNTSFSTVPDYIKRNMISYFTNFETVYESLKTNSSLEGWPPGIHGAALTDFKVPLSKLPQETQQMIASHPLSWTDERVANMSDEYLSEQFDILLEKDGIKYNYAKDKGESYIQGIIDIMNSRDIDIDPKFKESFTELVGPNGIYDEMDEVKVKRQEVVDSEEYSLATDKAYEDYQSLQKEKEDAISDKNLMKEVPDPKGEYPKFDMKNDPKIVELNKQYDEAYKAYMDYYDNEYSSAWGLYKSHADTLEEKNGMLYGTDEEIAKLKLLGKKVTSSRNELDRLSSKYDSVIEQQKQASTDYLNKITKQREPWTKAEEKRKARREEISKEYDELIDEAYIQWEFTFQVIDLGNGKFGLRDGGDYTDSSGKTYAGKGTLTDPFDLEIEELEKKAEQYSETLTKFGFRYMTETISPYLVNKQFKGKTIDWIPAKKGTGNIPGGYRSSGAGSNQGIPGYGSGYSISDPIVGGGGRGRRGRNSRRGTAFGESTLFEKLKQKQFFNPNDIKPTFPENPPPQLDPKTGMHPNYGKNAKRFRKLDPISANAMPPTGDPETDALVDKQRTKPKTKLYDRLKKNIRKDLTNK